MSDASTDRNVGSARGGLTLRASLPSAVGAGLAVVLAGCGLSGPDDGTREVPLSVSTTASQQLTRASVSSDSPSVSVQQDEIGAESGVSRSVTLVGTGGDTLVVDYVAFLVGDALLKPGDVDQCGGDTACVDLRSTARLVTVPLDGTARPQIQKRVPLGLYDQVSFRLLTAGDSNAALLDSLPELEGNSVVVKGTFNGQSFSATQALTGTVNITVTPGLEITQSTDAANLTLATAVSSWYQLSDGTVVDPRQESGQLSIELLEASTSGYPDRDGDGEPDSSGPASP